MGAVRDALPPRGEGARMKFAGLVESGDCRSSQCIDNSALIAFLDRSDSFHSLFRRLFPAPPLLVTSSLVIAEGRFNCWLRRCGVGEDRADREEVFRPNPHLG